MGEGRGRERDNTLSERGQVDDRDEQGDADEAALAYDLALLTDVCKGDLDADPSLVSAAEYQESVVSESGVVESR